VHANICLSNSNSNGHDNIYGADIVAVVINKVIANGVKVQAAGVGGSTVASRLIY